MSGYRDSVSDLPPQSDSLAGLTRPVHGQGNIEYSDQLAFPHPELNIALEQNLVSQYLIFNEPAHRHSPSKLLTSETPMVTSFSVKMTVGSSVSNQVLAHGLTPLDFQCQLAVDAAIGGILGEIRQSHSKCRCKGGLTKAVSRTFARRSLRLTASSVACKLSRASTLRPNTILPLFEPAPILISSAMNTLSSLSLYCLNMSPSRASLWA